jgi:hypothetical protein
MLKGNLSTRPFYNERLVAVLIVAALIVGIALTAFNVTTTVRLSAERTSQRAAHDRVEAEAAKSRASASAVQGTLDRSNLLALAADTNEANTLIDQRTFSWTAFFGLVEKTLPLDARLIAVAPRVERGVFLIVMQLNLKRPEDLEAFMASLAGTGAFYDLLPSEMQRNDDGIYIATLSGGYNAPGMVGARTKAGVRKGGPRP